MPMKRALDGVGVFGAKEIVEADTEGVTGRVVVLPAEG